MKINQLQFEERLRMLERKHHAMERGYVTHMQPDGLIVARPKRRPMRISGRSVLMFLLGFIVFKGFLIANLGPVTYGERLGYLQNGTPVEQAGALVMQIDPISNMVARQIGPVMR